VRDTVDALAVLGAVDGWPGSGKRWTEQ